MSGRERALARKRENEEKNKTSRYHQENKNEFFRQERENSKVETDGEREIKLKKNKVWFGDRHTVEK